MDAWVSGFERVSCLKAWFIKRGRFAQVSFIKLMADKPSVAWMAVKKIC